MGNNLYRPICNFIKYIECNLKKLDTEVSQLIRNHTARFLEEMCSSPSCGSSNFDRKIVKLLKITKLFLADHPNLIVTRADKGNTTVALDRDDYLAKMSDL